MPWEVLESHAGQLAGVGTAALWTVTALFFHAAIRSLGTTAVNMVRIALAIVLLGVAHRFLAGVWVPNIRGEQVFYLALSGFLGLSIGDQALLTAYGDIGPRLALLVMTTAPLFATFLGFVVLDERPGGAALIGIAVTIAGVAWVVLERRGGNAQTQAKRRVRGMVLALLAAMCQAGGLLLSKKGIGHGWLPKDQHIAPQTATLVRMVFAGVGMLPILIPYFLNARRRRRETNEPQRRDGAISGLLLTAGGAVTGPFLGVWLSLVACSLAPLGVAQTLCSLAPVFILPFAALLEGERISARAIMGALIAVAGTAILFSGSP